MTELGRREQNRIEKKARALDAALAVFAEQGFASATMDTIAAKAGLSKPTLYQYFASKQDLFQEVLLAPRQQMLLAIDERSVDCHVTQLWQFSWAYAEIVLRRDFLALARLVIGDAQRFPDLARAYQENGPDRVLRGLAAFMTKQTDIGTLEITDPILSAEDFWGLILSSPRNTALHIVDTSFTKTELKKYIKNGLRVFLKAYSVHPCKDLLVLKELCDAPNP